jgi:tetratricopeptide (TPR) repeat protein
MSGALAHKKPTREKATRSTQLKSRTADKGKGREKGKERGSGSHETESTRKLPIKNQTKAVASKHPSDTVHQENKIMEADTRKPANQLTGRDTPSRLLRESKTTSAALAFLEKGIKLIYQKEFKKARAELKILVDTYPSETDILARAHSYIRICDREEATHKRPNVTNDQLYTLGVMAHNRGDFDNAISFFRQSLEKHRDSDYIYYSLSASSAMKGDAREAISTLRKAVELNDENRIFAKNDSDFASLHAQKEFADLVGINMPPVIEP